MLFLRNLLKKQSFDVNHERFPLHIAIIMDGNGRWAKKRGLVRTMGHKKGADVLKKIVNVCCDINIKYLTVYAFSTENWKRPQSEVDYLMNLFLKYLKEITNDKNDNGKDICVKFIGDMSGLSKELQTQMKKTMDITKNRSKLNLLIAVNYGSRAELVNATKDIVKDFENSKISIDDICEDYISGKLYTAEIPCPDILIRTAGEHRISNFILWQLAYTELFFTDVLWPDFSKQHLFDIISRYLNRKRTYGGI